MRYAVMAIACHVTRPLSHGCIFLRDSLHGSSKGERAMEISNDPQKTWHTPQTKNVDRCLSAVLVDG